MHNRDVAKVCGIIGLSSKAGSAASFCRQNSPSHGCAASFDKNRQTVGGALLLEKT